MHRSLTATALSLAAVAAPAQLPVPPAAPTPIFRMPAEPADPSGTATEIWTVGADFKASFHDGFAFYPYLGPSYPKTLGWRWRLRSVRAGATELIGGAPETRQLADRFEYRHRLLRGGAAAAVVEAYDVRQDGIEQSFVLTAPLGVAGDLIVEGAVETPLLADHRGDACAPLSFAGPRGEALVRYGSARAFDGGGRSVAVPASWDGSAVRLTVPRAWLRDASYPVTVDPLVGTSGLSAGSGTGLPGRPEVVAVDGSRQNLLVVHTRAWSATDWDCYASVYDRGFTNERAIYRDPSASYSTLDCAATFVGQTRQWVVVHDRQAIGTQPFASSITMYQHALGNTTIGSGLTRGIGVRSGYLGRPDVGGTLPTSRSGPFALAVCEATVGYRPEILALTLDTSGTGPIGSFVPASTSVGPTESRGFPTITPMSKGTGDSWMVAWQERVTNGTWQIRGSLIEHDRQYPFYTAGLFPPVLGKHALRPRVAGAAGRFLLTCTIGTDANGPAGETLYAERIDWPTATPFPQQQTARVIANTPGTNGYANSDLAYDHDRRSHWGMAWERYVNGQTRVEVARVGYTGGAVEYHNLGDQHHTPAIAFDPGTRSFPFVYSTSAYLSLFLLLGDELTYDPAAGTSTYGTSCGGRISSAATPDAGYEFFTVDLTSGPASKLAFLFLSGTQASTPLDSIGMPGCVLHVGPALVLPAVTNASGYAQLTLPLPDFPPFFGDLHAQWVHEWATPLGLAATEGLQISVR